MSVVQAVSVFSSGGWENNSSVGCGVRRAKPLLLASSAKGGFPGSPARQVSLTTEKVACGVIMGENSLDLLTLQGRIAEDAPGYKDEFLLQLRHYQACLELFSMRPNKDTKQFCALVRFVAAVSDKYPDETILFGQELMDLLERHSGVLDSDLRKAVVHALVTLRKKSMIPLMTVLPLFFRLFHCPDKSLRKVLYKHVVADIKNCHKLGKGQISKKTKGFLLNMINDSDELISKKSLAILSDLWRREVWRDIHTANVIASATEHSQSSVVLAAVKFFLGYDITDDDMDSDDEDEDEINQRAMLDTNDVKNAQMFGSKRALRKKKRKLERVQHSLRKSARKELANVNEGFAATQLLQDPQRFAERLFNRVKSGRDRFESKLVMIQLISRVIGIHKLMMLNFYPFLQKYLITRQQDVMVVMSSLVQACHELVPPEALSLVLRHLVDTFVHDRARPEVITIGLKTVREICVRVPMVMSEDLLSDLVMYKTSKDKEVSSAARSLISLFRDVAPSMLERKHRGRGALLEAKPLGYAEMDLKHRISGADLLQTALENGDIDPDGSSLGEESDFDGLGGTSDEEDESDSGEETGDVDLGEGVDAESDSDVGLDMHVSVEPVSGQSESEEEEDSVSGDDISEAESGEEEAGSDSDEDFDEDFEDAKVGQKRGREADPESMRSLKKRITALKQAKAKAKAEEEENEKKSIEGGEEETQEAKPVPIEMARFLDDRDFANMRSLRKKSLVKEAMKRHGLLSAFKKHKLEEIAEADAHEALRLNDNRSRLSEEKVVPGSLMGKRRGKPSKAERVAEIMKGREGSEFKSSSNLKKKKTGGTSNKEKSKKMDLPLAARMNQAKNRMARNKLRRNPKNFKGHFGKKKGGVRKK
ncbi:hypothetical protein BSKO_11507 [Bryopsis sp. KO-2023]|nr:hypothetical protein BSKO_11507 [Bryopsis sp. KO-2023]